MHSKLESVSSPAEIVSAADEVAVDAKADEEAATPDSLVAFWSGAPHSLPTRILDELETHRRYSPKAIQLGVESEEAAALMMYLGTFADIVLRTRSFLERTERDMGLPGDPDGEEFVWKQPRLFGQDIEWEKSGYFHLEMEVPGKKMREGVTWKDFFTQINDAMMSWGVSYEEVAALIKKTDSESKSKLIRLLLPVFINLQVKHGYQGTPDLSQA